MSQIPFDTIPALVDYAETEFGERIYIEDVERTLTFAETAAEARRAARAFVACGIEPGDRVAIWAPNIWEWVVTALGLHLAGGVLVPLNTRYKGTEAAYILEKSGARALFAVQGFLGNDYVSMLREAAGESEGTRPVAGLPDLERLVVLRGDVPTGTTSFADFVAGGAVVSDGDGRARALAVDTDDLSDLLFTSGTTGHPKGVMTSHGQNLRAFLAWTEVIGLRAGDRYLIVNPFFHAFGYKAGWLACMMRGATVLPHAVFDAGQVLERLGRDRVSVLPGPPALFQMILANPKLTEVDLSSLRLSVTGAAVIPVQLIEQMRDDLGFDTVITGYGLTEACGIATMCRFDDDPITIATTSGKAIPGVEVRCVDDQSGEVPRGEPGEVVVRGYNVMKGYFDDAGQTAETIDADGWLHTGDIGVMDERGYLRITDRKKDMYIMGGFNCYPAEIENLLLNHPDIGEAAVVGVPDDRMGEVGMAYVVATAGSQVTPSDIIAWARDHMANFKVPRYVEAIEALPRNALGKVQKFKLREQAGARLARQK